METILLSLNHITREQLKEVAQKERRSVNNYINVLLEKAIKEELK